MKSLLSLVLLLAVPLVDAQVKVVDSSPQSVRTGVNVQQDAAQRAEIYDQLQALQREVAELRGLVEEQTHEISRLKQLQLDNYVDLDRRIGLVTSGKASSVAESPAATPNSSDLNSASAADDYKNAYDLLRKGQSDQAQNAFKEFLSKYSNNELAPNACYWLGKISITKGQMPQAKDWFVKLIDSYPSSNKLMDAKFELGRIYDVMGDKAKAKSLLTEVAASNSESARLAKQYLKDNF